MNRSAPKLPMIPMAISYFEDSFQGDEIQKLAANTWRDCNVWPISQHEGLDRLQQNKPPFWLRAFASYAFPCTEHGRAVFSNSNGYKSVLLAAAEYPHVPMLMTAAGTVKPARVVIMGVGVAGLQAPYNCKTFRCCGRSHRFTSNCTWSGRITWR